MTNKDYIWVLEAEGYGRVALKHNPDGWKEQKITIDRSPSFFGLFTSMSGGIRFVKDGYDYVKRIYEEKGFDYEVKLAIYEYRELPEDRDVLEFAGFLDLSTYNISELYIDVDIIESTLARKIASRDDLTMDITDNTSVGNIELSALPSVTARLREREILLSSAYEIDETNADIGSSQSAQTPGANSGIVIPVSLAASDLENLNDIPFGQPDAATACFWNPSGNTLDVKFNYKLRGNFNGGPDVTGTRKILVREYFDATFTSFADREELFTTSGNYGVTVPFNLDDSFELTIPPDSYISFMTYGTAGNDFYQNHFDEAELSFTINEFAEATTSQAYISHEIGRRIIEKIADEENGDLKKIFVSDVLGSKELGYENDGKYHEYVNLSGLGIRNFPSPGYKINLKKWFKSMTSMFNLGLGIEYDELNRPYIRLEEKKHFFSGVVAGTLHSVTELEKSVANDWIYNSVKVGYEKSEYEATQGLEEYNNKFEWANSITRVKNELDLVSSIRADGNGIEQARRKPFSLYPTEDTKYDNDNFIIKSTKSGNMWFSDQAENYDIVEEIFSPETAYNLDLTPGRMFRNNGDLVRAGLEKKLNTEITFQGAEQKANLASQRTGSFLITENENIDPSTLTPALWIPEIYKFKSPLTRDNIAKFTRNPNGLWKFSSTTKQNTVNYSYGWIIGVEADPESRTAEWQLLRANTLSPELTIIDPEGNTPDTPSTPVEDILIPGVFQSTFPIILLGSDIEQLNIITEDDININTEDDQDIITEDG